MKLTSLIWVSVQKIPKAVTHPHNVGEKKISKVQFLKVFQE